MRKLALGTTIAVVLGLVGLAPPAQAAPASITEICAHVFVSPFNAAAGATVKTLNAKGKSVSVGRAASDRVIGGIIGGVDGSTCSLPRTTLVEDVVVAVETDIEESGREVGLQTLRDAIASLSYSPSTRTRGKLPDPGTAKCEEFAPSTLAPPDAYMDAIAMALFAGTLGDPALAAEGAAKARSIVESWAESNADGKATTVSDWTNVLDYLQEAGASDFHKDRALVMAQSAAKDAFARYNKSECRSSAKDIECLMKAVIVLKSLGAAPPGADAAVRAGLRAWKDGAGQGKRVKCPLERYQFQMTYTEQGGQRGFSKFDTGLITFEVKDGRITSKDKGPLVITGGTGGCYEKIDDVWMRVGSGTINGGSYPFKVGGTDLGDEFLLQLRPPAKVTGSFSGAEVCPIFGELGLQFVNSTLASFADPGIELPAGAFNVDESVVSREIYEPTGETVVGTLRFVYRMVYPRR
jgi:hypothetical protein